MTIRRTLALAAAALALAGCTTTVIETGEPAAGGPTTPSKTDEEVG